MARPEVRRFFFLAYDLARQLRRWQEKISRDEGLTLPQIRALGQLSHRDGITQTELANLIESDPMTVGGVVERLEARGLVTRCAHPTDSRAKMVAITDEARVLVETFRAKAAKFEPAILEGISDDELATALSVIERLSGNLNKNSHVFEVPEQ